MSPARRAREEGPEEIVVGPEGQTDGEFPVAEGEQVVEVTAEPVAEPVQVFIDTGRGNAIPVNVGEPFAEAIERVADAANYGGYYRVFLQGREVADPAAAPQMIAEGQRIAITAYDKVGLQLT